MKIQSIARASYARKQVAIFDDVLSGLDALTEEKVCARLLSRNGLLRTLGTSIILATHSGEYIKARAQLLANGNSEPSFNRRLYHSF